MRKYMQNIVGGLCVAMLPMTAWSMSEGYKQLSYWSFELGTELHSDSIAPTFVVDNSQNGNALQLRPGAKVSELFSKDVPFQVRGGKANSTSLKLNNSEFKVPFNASLPFWTFNTGGTSV